MGSGFGIQNRYSKSIFTSVIIKNIMRVTLIIRWGARDEKQIVFNLVYASKNVPS